MKGDKVFIMMFIIFPYPCHSSAFMHIKIHYKWKGRKDKSSISLFSSRNIIMSKEMYTKCEVNSSF